MRTCDRAADDNRMTADEDALHRIFRCIEVAFHDHDRLAFHLPAHVCDHAVIRAFNMRGFLGIAVQCRRNDFRTVVRSALCLFEI